MINILYAHGQLNIHHKKSTLSLRKRLYKG
jgi:hypothetical protein